jgi:hypothetical protein
VDAARRRVRNEQGPPRDPFNLSNDHHYEIPKHVGARQRVRQTFGQLEVQHAYPALKLQLPFVSVLRTITVALLTFVSIKRDFRSKTLVHSIALRCSSMQTLNVISQKYERPRRKKTSQVEHSAKVEKSARPSNIPAILAYAKTPISSYGNTP